MAVLSKAYPYDALTSFKDASTAVTATGTAQNGGVDEVLDLGADSRTDGTVVINVLTIDEASANETYEFVVQGSNDATFVTGVYELGGRTVAETGQVAIPISNEKIVDGVLTKLRYVRLRHVLGGTTPSLSYTAYLAKDY
jgi:hypothetical protein